MESPTDKKGLIETEEIILDSIHDILTVVRAWCEADAQMDPSHEGRVHLVDFCVKQVERLLVPPPEHFD